MSETNHASKAEKLEGLAIKVHDTEYALVIAQVATAEAILALVEQQRIANLIAFTTANGGEPSETTAEEIGKGVWL